MKTPINIELKKDIFGTLDIDPENIIGVFNAKSITSNGLSDEEIHDRIVNPVGTPPLKEIVQDKKDVLIITDDNTRATPLHRILPQIFTELEVASIKPENITILIGLGTHRPMTEDEIIAKFGEEVYRKYKIVNHLWSEKEHLTNLGRCKFGYEVIINKLVKKADFIITVGNIVPHATTGFSGGGKTVMPGICGEKTIEDTHWTALDYSMQEIIGNFDNRVRNSIIEICRKINLSFIVNTILFNGNVVYDLVAGDVEAAHYHGAEICKSVYGVDIPKKADIVIAEAYPTDIDLRQAIKAMCTADLVCKNTGVIILLAECPEGLAPPVS